MMRSKSVMLNFLTNVFLEVVTIISGFILPRLLMQEYGSAAYGLTTSITQFLGYLTLLQSGVGGVVRAALYKPLADDDHQRLNAVINTTESFFRKIAYIGIGYTAILVVAFGILQNEFSFGYTASLVVIISIGSLLQYYFGITGQMLLQAHQKSYIYSVLQLICTILNVAVVIVSIQMGLSLHMTKLLSVLIFAVRPILINIYIKRKYQLSKKGSKNNDIISQRWNALGQTIAYFTHTKTPIFLITLFMTLQDVSIYSVYLLVTTGLTTIVTTISNAVQSAFGDMLARNEIDTARKRFDTVSLVLFSISTLVFSTAIVAVLPFVRVYTNGLVDAADYIQPIFAVLIILSECIYCYRLPYHTIIISAGHYKQTKIGAYIEAGINIVVSTILIFPLGFLGVAIGSLLAMAYRTLEYVKYLEKNIIYSEKRKFLMRFIIHIAVVAISIVVALFTYSYTPNGYTEWIGFAVCVMGVLVLLIFGLDMMFFRLEMKDFFFYIKSLTMRRKGKP